LPGLTWQAYTPELRAALQQADVFVFPSIEEGSALVTYDALACGLPVITTPNAGSVVRDEIDGLIVPIRDVGALAAALQRLREDRDLRERMGRSARTRAEEYPWSRYRHSLLAAYRQVLNPDCL
jgi:glycosyltransferase involved in cell wall biosynthesis